jgi:hypothetical protein
MTKWPLLSFFYAQRRAFVALATDAAAVANPALRLINSKIDVKASPMTVMGVYVLLGDVSLMMSGLVNNNPYRTIESLISLPHAMMYLFKGHHYQETPSISLNQIGDIFSLLNPKAEFKNLTWPQPLPTTDSNHQILLTSMQCWDIAQGITALTEQNPLDSEVAQSALDQAYQLFLENAQNGTLDERNYPKNPQEAFLLFCQANAPYYKNPVLRAVQSLGDLKRNPMGVAQITACVSQIFGIFAGLQTSPAGQTHPLEVLNGAVTLALKCLVIAGSMKNVADTVRMMQAYQVDHEKKPENSNFFLIPFNAILDRANAIYAAVSLAMDTPTTGLDAVMASLGKEHDLYKLLSFISYTIDLIIRLDLDHPPEQESASNDEASLASLQQKFAPPQER